MSSVLLKTEKRVKLKGKVNSIVREQYLRDDLQCRSPICEQCSNEQKNGIAKSSMLCREATHYVIPAFDTVQKFLEIFEMPDIKGIIILQSIALKLLKCVGRSYFRRLFAISHDCRRGCTVFLNEISKQTFQERLPSQSEEVWLAKSVLKVAQYYCSHLDNRLPIYIVTEKPELFKSDTEPNDNAWIVSMKSYLELLWCDLKDAHDLCESISEASLVPSIEDSSKVFDSYLPADVLEAGVKSGRYCRGTLRVNKHISSQEAYISSSRVFMKESGDILIHGLKDRNRAIHGDDVAVELLPKDQWKSKCQSLITDSETAKESCVDAKESSLMPTGKVIGILDRRWRDYVATFPDENEESLKTSRANSERILVFPYDYRIPKIRIATKQAETLRNQRIVVRIDGWEKNSQYPNGHFVKTLGEIGHLETEVQSLLVEHGISGAEFPSNLLPELPTCTEDSPWTVDEVEVQKRKDLRLSHLIFSIDPKGCEDVDDALSIRRLNNGMLELGVHIADVTYFVHEASLTDLEARSNATSVYLPDRRYDMLPSVLSGNLCSLLGNVDRYAVSVMWILDSNFEVQDVWYGRTVICSRYKLCYEDAQSILSGCSMEEMKGKIEELIHLDENSLLHSYTQLKDALFTLAEISSALRTKRLACGGLELNSINMKFEIDKTLSSIIKDFKQVQELEIHKAVAECMIFANHWVAKRIAESFPQQAVLRHHPAPREPDLLELQKMAASKGFTVDISSNKELASSLEEAVDPDNPVVNQIFRIMATRAMNEATYFCTGCYKPETFYHYGLGIPYYTHFTSPIRRYADVLVHRLLLVSVNESDEFLLKMAEVESLCEHMNEKHRAAQDVEKRAQELFQTFFFNQLVSGTEGCLASGVIYAIKTNGVLVFVPQYGIKGAVYLCDKDKKVAIVKDSVMWVDGQLEVKDMELVVKSADTVQKYALFDQIMVYIKAQMPKAHQPSIVLQLAKYEPSFVPIVHRDKSMGTRENLQEKQPLSEKFNSSDASMDIVEIVESKRSLYHILKNFQNMTLLAPT